MAAISTAATVILTLLLLAPVFSYLPQAALGALVFVAAVGLVDINTSATRPRDLDRLATRRPRDAVGRFRQVFGPGDAEFFPRVSDAVAAHLDELEGRD
jgi:Sulfate permease family